MEAIARLRNYPTSPFKMRLLADLIRGKEVQSALVQLEFSTKHPSVPLRKLLLSAISNWKQKNNLEEVEGLYIKTIYVDGARSLKRILPAPQGRAYKIKKRSNHVTIIVDQREVVSLNKDNKADSDEKEVVKDFLKTTSPETKVTSSSLVKKSTENQSKPVKTATVK